ncbi:hypothetical protein [Jannaschia aquimarina]|uniref:Uncharacterized protein n=1 Tax=Jannaschia aquimarina TaxID=935700 RepID=A0A0D1ED08_9RHOB|nr:hypothetical protein [Jannaschia aquimarina]KIT14806.1 hypothetical protein jaqu_31310 [Jannaschia aquimarina]SNS56547.1 hypothetical protein SAMN05421775_101456 [Jannaschia aquimarina]
MSSGPDIGRDLVFTLKLIAVALTTAMSMVGCIVVSLAMRGPEVGIGVAFVGILTLAALGGLRLWRGRWPLPGLAIWLIAAVAAGGLICTMLIGGASFA